MTLDKKTLDDLRIDRGGPSRTQANSSKPFVTILIVIFLLAIGGFAAWRFTQSKPDATPTATETPAQKTASNAKPASSDRTLLNASGYITARRKATVSSKVTGKVIDVLVEEGMAVKADQILAHIDSSNTEKSLQLAEAQLEAARKSLDETKANLKQAQSEAQRRAGAGNAVSKSEVERADTDVQALKARLERQIADVSVAERELGTWKQQMDDTIIRAPFPGIVTSKNAQPGEIISPMSAGGGFTRTGICTIVDMSSLEIEVDVSESYINRVSANQPVEATLDSYPNWKIPAKVIAIIPTADRQKATVKVRGFESLDPRMLPDMSVKVAFQSGAEPKPADSPAVTGAK